MANKKIIELDAASQVNSDAVFPLSQLVSDDQKTLKATIAQIQSAVLAPVADMVTLGESSGSIASFSTDISDKLFSCYVNVVATQAGSGTPAPDNVRAISGWSACGLVGCQKNILDYNAWKSSTPTSSRCTYVFQNNGISITATAGDGYCRPSYEIPVRSGQQITLSWSSESNIIGTVYVFFSDTNFVYVLNSAQKLVTTIPDDCSKIRIRFGVANTGNTINYANLQIEYNDTSTTYEPYNGTTHNIPFNTTVYGGVLDVLSGVLTVTHGIETFDGSNDEIWSYSADSGTGRKRVYIAISGAKPNSVDLVSNMLITQGVVSGYPDIWKCSFNGNSTPSLIIGVDNSITSSSDWTTYISNHNLVVVYELATPTTIQLTPIEVKTILGQNNIFADCGDIDLKYLETIGNRL